MNKIKIIACTGDSHTWGQGGAASKAHFESWASPVVAGEHRLLSWGAQGYVTLLRETVNAATASSACEYRAETLSRIWNRPMDGDCVDCSDEELTFSGELLRLQFRLTASPAWVRVTVDGSQMVETSLTAENTKNPYNLLSFLLTPGAHTLRFEGGIAFLYRVETYSGEYAVVNCGVGSCPVSRFLPVYAPTYVDALKPNIVLAQGHTINDWLTPETPDEYADALRGYLTHEQNLGARTVMLAVEPILGRQNSSCGAAFSEYIAASLRAAADSHTPIADAYGEMLSRASLPDGSLDPAWFEDNWHPNFRGHRLYADCVWKILREML